MQMYGIMPDWKERIPTHESHENSVSKRKS